LAREDRPGDKRLVAYLTGEGTATAELRRHLAASLPEYMIPAAFVVLPSLPLSPNGKVDRKLLPAPEAEITEDREPVAPRTPLESYLAGLWRERLGVESVGIRDDFFALGGNSISGAVLINQIQEKLGEIVHVVVLFDAPTVERMAAYLVENHARAVERIWGLAAGGDRREDRVDAARVAQIRALIDPLPPLAAGGAKNPPAVFVLAPPRSGTTLLRVLLGGHPRLFAPPELELLTHDTMAGRRAAYTGRDSFWLEGLVRAVMEIRGCGPDEAAAVTAGWERDGWSVQRAYRQLQEWLGNRLLVDKTPSYAFDPGVLRRAEEGFDGALYVHLVRHPGGMIRSFDEAKLDRIFFRRPHPFTRRELAELLWLISQENILGFLKDIPEERRHTVRFEELVRDPEPVLRGLCAFLGLDFESAMLRPYDGRRMTDGLRAESRMLGDVKFHTHSGIEAGVAERWRDELAEESLGEETVRLAAALGYRMPPILTASIPRRLPGPAVPSFAQERLWFLARLEPDSPFYNIPAALRLTGGLDVAALARSLAAIRRRHEALRTIFADGPVQIIAPSSRDLEIVDLSALPEDVRQTEAGRLADEEARRPFDLEAGPLLRTTLLGLDAREHALLVTMHHIVSDGWSMGLFLGELSDLYAGRTLPELSIQYADFAAWQRERLRGPALDEQLAWWRERLDGAPALLELPTDRPRPAVQRFRGGQVPVRFGEDLAGSLAALGRRRSATLFMTLLAGFQAVLSAWSGQDDVSVGSPVAGRLRPETEPLIGLFVNTLVLRTEIDRGQSFDELLGQVQRGAVAAFAHQEIPFEKIVEELKPERSLAWSPLFQVLFAFQNAPRPRIALPGVAVSALRSGGGTAKFDLSLGLAERDGRLGGGIEYDADLFDPATAERLAGGLETLLRAAAEDPARPVPDLPLLTPAERRQLLEWNDTGTIATGGTLHGSFEAQADRTPEAEALVRGREVLTYAELDRRANRLARRLRRLGVGPEARVGVALERSADLVVALLAVLKAGGAYVPLDPAYPPERLALIREDAGCRVIVDRESLLDLDEEEGRLPGTSGPGNLAYLIYTSGSTGRPKGVAIEHRSAAALLAWAGEVFGPEDLAGVLASTSITFDLSVFELFLPLARGGRVTLAENALALPDLPMRDRVRLVNTVPSAMAELLRLGAVPESVRTVNLAGEPLKRSLADRIYALPHVEAVYNLYGPSEDTTYSTWVRVPRNTEREPTIGVPVMGTRAWVVDRGLGLLPVGVPGELCLAGAGLARGYLNRPDLTAASFVPHPFGGPGERMYRTGDLARWTTGGELEFLGRIDHQVKVRGFRIEPGEIETALLAHPGVREAVVLALGEGAERRLVAFVVGETTGLRAWLEPRLPAHMVPSAFVVLPALPLTPNGKVDRKALARVEEREPEREPATAAAALSPVQDLLAGIWSEVLRRGPVGPEDGFFDLGGHSLLATRVVSRVRELLGVELPLRAVFEAPTLAGLAARIEAVRAEGLDLQAPPIVRISRTPEDTELRASFAQERLWFLDRFGSDRAAYNLATAIHLRGRLDPAALAATLKEIVRRHESLRTTFAVTPDGRVLQAIGPVRLDLPVVDLRGMPGELARLAREAARRPFDLARGPLLRAALTWTGEDEHTLLLTQHHIVSDGWSIGVLLRELSALYRGASLPELSIQYADFAAWQREWLQGATLERQLGWWRDHLAGAPPVLELPADRPRPPVPSGKGGRFAVGLPTALRDGVQALARHSGATPFMVLLAAFQALLGRLADRDDVPVGTPIAGRGRSETEGLIGFFINTLVLRADLSGNPGFGDLLGRTRKALLGAYDHQDLPFEKLVEELQPERSLAHSPLFQVMFILQNAPLEGLDLPGVTAVPVVPDSGTTKFDLRLSLTETAAGLAGSVLYNLDLFDEATAKRLAGQYERLLAAAVADPEARLSDLPLLGEAEIHHLLREWNDTRVDWSLEESLHGWIEEQVRRTPDAPAVTFEGETLTYRELDERAGRLADALGDRPDELVGISAERSLELVVGLLGILKAGAAYVPIDPGYPADRIAYMVEDSGVSVLDAGAIRTQTTQRTARTKSSLPSFGSFAAYMIYTSGSTGRPKGAVNTHRAIVNRLVWMQEQYGLTAGDVVLQKTPFSFDVSVWELFWPLMVGARLVVAKPGGHQDSAYLADLIRREGVTTLHFVPSMLQVFLEQPGVETCTSIRRVI
ncbi:MAG TPA: amino acid adenylation domain-containing protein, partial [Thermoanaerobaculia bacterium]|nr:amino acid adenylation domain-containing protein [Thermoanaerobaculia bacterium]